MKHHRPMLTISHRRKVTSTYSFKVCSAFDDWVLTLFLVPESARPLIIGSQTYFLDSTLLQLFKKLRQNVQYFAPFYTGLDWNDSSELNINDMAKHLGSDKWQYLFKIFGNNIIVSCENCTSRIPPDRLHGTANASLSPFEPPMKVLYLAVPVTIAVEYPHSTLKVCQLAVATRVATG